MKKKQVKRRRRIGIDFDDVLVDFTTALALFHNKAYGTSYARKQVVSCNHEDIWGCTREEAVNRVHQFYNSREHIDASPVPGAVQAIRSLARNNDLFVVTSRPEIARGVTLALAERHFPDKFTSIQFTNHYTMNCGKKRTKAQVCKEFGLEIFIDDFPMHVIDIRAAGIPALLFDAPWNQGPLSAPITRVHSWDEILAHL